MKDPLNMMRTMYRHILQISFSFILFVFFTGCDEVKNDPNDAAAAFVEAKEAYDDEYFEMALPKLQEFKARFPYSKYSTEAELLIADAHFRMDQFPEAAAVYDQFTKLHPNHPKVDFALFRVGECYWKEAPEELDREQEFTEKAISIWAELKSRYPRSKYNSEAGELTKVGKRRLADSEHFVAKFYCKLQKWGACAYRAMGLIENHSQYKDLLKEGARLGHKAFSQLAKGREKGTIKEDANLITRSMDIAKLKSKAQELDSIYKKL